MNGLPLPGADSRISINATGCFFGFFCAVVSIILVTILRCIHGRKIDFLFVCLRNPPPPDPQTSASPPMLGKVEVAHPSRAGLQSAHHAGTPQQGQSAHQGVVAFLISVELSRR